jgi:hypothetical protein
MNPHSALTGGRRAKHTRAVDQWDKYELLVLNSQNLNLCMGNDSYNASGYQIPRPQIPEVWHGESSYAQLVVFQV